LDRRRIQKRISRLERDLAEFRKTRQTQSKARLRTGVPMISLVGYTNAGKSTLLNQLTAADVLAEDRLFSTLDSTVRKFTLPDGRPVLLSDTVGFVRRLPHHLIEAFRSTLEQVRESALLVHMVDASDAEPEEQIAAVREVLDEIGASDVAELLVLNKSDVADPATLNRLTNLHPEAVVISARTGTGLTELGQAISDRLRNTGTVVRLEIPYDRADILAAAHRDGEVMAEKHDENGSVIEVRLPAADLPRFQPFVASS
jgi:GTP-binding protein HflX